jgi:hypothetical protein
MPVAPTEVMRQLLALLVLTAACVDGNPMLERDELEIPDTQGELAPLGAFAAFMTCMRYDDFVASNMQSAWAMAPEAAFAQLKARTYVQLQYFRYDRVNDVVDINEEAMATAARAVADATNDLYQRTQTRLATRTCN